MIKIERELINTELWKHANAFRMLQYFLLTESSDHTCYPIQTGRGYMNVELRPGEFAFTRRLYGKILGMKHTEAESALSFLVAMKYVQTDKNIKFQIVTVNHQFLKNISASNLSAETLVSTDDLSDGKNYSRQQPKTTSASNLSAETLVSTDDLSDGKKDFRQQLVVTPEVEKLTSASNLSAETPINTGGLSDSKKDFRQQLSFLSLKERESISKEEENISLKKERAREISDPLEMEMEYGCDGDRYSASEAFDALSKFASTDIGKNEIRQLGRYSGSEEDLQEIIRKFALKFNSYKTFSRFMELKSYFISWVAREKNMTKSNYNPTAFNKTLNSMLAKTNNAEVMERVKKQEKRLMELMKQPVPDGTRFIPLSTTQVVELAWNLTANGSKDPVTEIYTLMQGVFKESFYKKFNFLADAIKERYKFLNQSK